MKNETGNKETKYNVCIMGVSFDTGNRGVSALAASLIKIIHDIRPDTHFSFFIGNRTSKPQELEVSGMRIKVDVINFRLSPRANVKEHIIWILIMAFLWRIVPFQIIRDNIIKFNPRLNALMQADFIGDILGGDSFSDIYGIKRLIYGLLPDIIVLLLNKNLVLLPQTYGPYKSFLAKHIAKYIMSKSVCILSRDIEGVEIVKKILRDYAVQKPLYFCPDVAFTLESKRPIAPDIDPLINQYPNVPLIGLNINGLMYNGGYTRSNMFGLKFDYKVFVHKLLMRLMEETTVHLLLVPHTFGPTGNINSDPDANRDVLKSLADSYKNRIHLIMREYDQSEVKGIIGLCNFFIGSRMHACIAAMSQGIPTVGVAYSRKFKGVFDSIGQRKMVIDARVDDLKTGVSNILKLYQNAEKERSIINDKMLLVEDKIKRTFYELIAGDISQFSENNETHFNSDIHKQN